MYIGDAVSVKTTFQATTTVEDTTLADTTVAATTPADTTVAATTPADTTLAETTVAVGFRCFQFVYSFCMASPGLCTCTWAVQLAVTHVQQYTFYL